jgi:hypothetical protein
MLGLVISRENGQRAKLAARKEFFVEAVQKMGGPKGMW